MFRVVASPVSRCRHGGRASGVGRHVGVDYVKDIAELEASCAVSNKALVRELREDPNSEALLSLTQEDAAMGRMSMPVPLGKWVPDHVLLNPRFGVVQARDDGSTKVRAVDHLS